MTSDRASAYGRVMQMLRGRHADPLAATEVDVIREAADALLFSRRLEPYADQCLTAVITLGETLVRSGRWSASTLDRLIDHLADCGPGPQPVTSVGRTISNVG